MKGFTKVRARRLYLAFSASLACAPVLARAAVSLQWDPNPAPGIQGGLGVWNTSNSNWNDAGVATNWSNLIGATAIFGGSAGGNVQIPSPITAAGLQIDTAGYVIGATPTSALTLSSGAIAANADVTIAAPISTPAELVKSGAGVLTMTGQGTIRGNINIQQGTFSFSATAQLGGSANDVELSGGTLRYSSAASLTMGAGNTIIIDAAGGTIETPKGRLILAATGHLTGTGTLLKTGDQPLQITGVNTGFSGSLNVGQGPVWLQDAKAVNGMPITLSGGTLILRGDQPIDFKSAVSVVADGLISSDNISPQGMSQQSHALGDVSVSSGVTLSVASSTNNFLRVNNLSLTGGLLIGDSGVMIGGPFSGTGAVSFSAMFQAPEWFASGLIFSNGLSQTISNSLSTVAGSPGPVVGVGAGTAVVFNGTWDGGAENARGAVVLRSGGKFVAGSAAHLNTTASDLVAVRPFVVIGTGTGDTFELAQGFVADHTAMGTIADGFSSLEVRDATLISHASASLPVINKQSGFGAVQRAGNLIFSGTVGARWIVADAAQQYDGAILLNSSATFQTDNTLTHSGKASDQFDGSFQIPVAGATLIKEGVGNLILAGDQGYAPGAILKVNAGTVRFDTDPGAGWYSGNYTRGDDGKISIAPVPAGTLAVSVGGGSAASAVVFTPTVSRVDSIQINSNGSAAIAVGAHPGEKTVTTHSLTLAPGAHFDLGNGRFIVDYSGPSPLPAIAAFIKNGAIFSSITADPSMTIGYAEASTLLHLASNQSTTLAGLTIDATSIIMLPTRIGDANLDGRVTFSDFQRLEAGFGLPNQGWSGGDFNFDGVVNQADLKLFNENYGKSADFNLAPASPVPEPALLWAFGGILGFLRRVRRPTPLRTNSFIL